MSEQTPRWALALLRAGIDPRADEDTLIAAATERGIEIRGPFTGALRDVVSHELIDDHYAAVEQPGGLLLEAVSTFSRAHALAKAIGYHLAGEVGELR